MSTGVGRTDEEILARIQEIESQDWMGTQQIDLISFLSLEAARPFMTEEAKAEQTQESWVPESTPLEAARGYLPFAIDKATGHRGLSAGRSVDHFRAWLWLAGDAEYERVTWDAHAQYGAPVLRQVAEVVGFDWPQDDARLNRMADGLACEPGCMDGCGL